MLGRLRLYFLRDTENKRIHTITNTYQQALEYKEKLLQLDSCPHYTNWCWLHELNSKDISSWIRYKQIVGVDDHYKLDVFYYNKSEIASILRLNSGCIPLGCSFDTQVEKEVSKMADIVQKIMEKESGTKSQ